ncbi:hypothetical protein DSY14_16845 [Nocardiopsis sp. MG754419]|nr:hypothetical protein [Nocardiopsis sp. MG754419]
MSDGSASSTTQGAVAGAHTAAPAVGADRDPGPGSGDGRALSVPRDVTLGRSDTAAPLTERTAGSGEPVSPPQTGVPMSLRPEPQQAVAEAPTGTAQVQGETAQNTDAAAADATAAYAAAEGTASAAAASTDEVALRDRLGRPGRPTLAFAAIAGVVLMATPFAVNETSQRLPGTAMGLVDQQGVFGYFALSGAGSGADAASLTDQRAQSAAVASGPATAALEQPGSESGYVPEVLPQEPPVPAGVTPSEEPDDDGTGPSSDAPREGGPGDPVDTEDAESSSGDLAPDFGAGGDEDEDDRDSDPEDGGSEDSEGGEDGEGDGDSRVGALPDRNTDGPLSMTAFQGSEVEDTDDEGDGDPDPQREEPADDKETRSADAETRAEDTDALSEPMRTDGGIPLADAVPQESPSHHPREETQKEPLTPRSGEGSDSDEDSGVLEQGYRPTVEKVPAEGPPPPPEFRYAEVAGVGCAPNERIAYGTAGEFWHGDGTDSWAFGFEGGFTAENCDGRWHAIPVSGDPDVPNGKYAFWTFNIGFTDAACDVYVHIPDAESPRWVGGEPAQYQLHPSADPATSEPFASFTVDQVADKGGWVYVGSYDAPGDTISVKLQNSGADQVDGRDTNAHVVASAVRTRCN